MVLGTVGLTQVSWAQQPENPVDHSAHTGQQSGAASGTVATDSNQVFDSSQLTQQSQNGMHQGQGGMMQHAQDGQGGMMQHGQGGQAGMMQHGQDGQAGMMQHGQDGQTGMMQHGQNGQGGMMQNGQAGQGDMMQRMERMRAMMGMGGGAQANAGGQDAFSAIRAVVSQLEADPNTDWSKINIEALQNHLIDMQELTINARVETEQVDGGAIYRVTGTDRTLEAIRNMVPMHASQMTSETSWTARAEEIRNGIEVTVTAETEDQVQKIRALGFIGFMVSGEHHDQHHMAIVGADMSSMSEAGGGGHSH